MIDQLDKSQEINEMKKGEQKLQKSKE